MFLASYRGNLVIPWIHLATGCEDLNPRIESLSFRGKAPLPQSKTYYEQYTTHTVSCYINMIAVS